MVTELPLPDLILAEYSCELILAQGGMLPRHLGATLRGGIALLLKRAVCLHPELKYCRDCDLRPRCVYPAVFEPAPPAGSEVLSTHQDVPLPIVLRLPPHWRPEYQPGDELSFGLVLAGQLLRYLAYLVAAIEQLGQHGLGPNHIRYRLDRVVGVSPNGAESLLIYRAGLMYHADPSFSARVLGEPLSSPGPPSFLSQEREGGTFSLLPDREGGLRGSGPTVTLNFLTPTRLKHADRFVEGPPAFHVVIRALLRRVSSLSYFYGGQRWEIDYRGWIDRAETVQTAAAEVRWVDWERFSTRQQREMNLGGIVGTVTYAGEVAPFMPLLRLGELVHVGKAAVFGNGRYEIGE